VFIPPEISDRKSTLKKPLQEPFQQVSNSKRGTQNDVREETKNSTRVKRRLRPLPEELKEDYQKARARPILASSEIIQDIFSPEQVAKRKALVDRALASGAAFRQVMEASKRRKR